MNSTTKNLTLASILTSLCVVITIFALSTGIGYGLYLDFAIPIFFAIVYLKCGGKYSILSGIVSVLLVFIVVGDLTGALFMSQSFLLGIVCAYFMDKDRRFCSTSGVSPGRISTAFCSRMGPPSHSSLTKCTVAPVTLQPRARAA